MNALEDTRPIVHTTTASTNPNVIGEDLGQLLTEHPDLELASIRLIRDDQSVHIVGRLGPLLAGHHLVHSEAFIDQDDPRSHTEFSPDSP
jgi:hypothetical protein